MDIAKRIKTNRSINNTYIDKFIEENIKIWKQRKNIYKKWLLRYMLFAFCFSFLLSVFSWDFNFLGIIAGFIVFLGYSFIPVWIIFLIFVKLPEYKELSEKYITNLFKNSNNNSKYSKKDIYFNWDEEIINNWKNNNFLNFYTHSHTQNSIEFIENNIKVKWCELKTTKEETYYTKDNKKRTRRVVTNHNYILKISTTNLIEQSQKIYLVPKNKGNKDNKTTRIYDLSIEYLFTWILFIMIYWFIIKLFYMEEVYHLISNFDIKALFTISIPMLSLILVIILLFKLRNKYYHNKKIKIPDNQINKKFDIYSNSEKWFDYSIHWKYIENIFREKSLNNLEFLLTSDAIYVKLKLNTYFFIKKAKLRNIYLTEIKKLHSDIDYIMKISWLIIK